MSHQKINKGIIFAYTDNLVFYYDSIIPNEKHISQLFRVFLISQTFARSLDSLYVELDYYIHISDCFVVEKENQIRTI